MASLTEVLHNRLARMYRESAVEWRWIAQLCRRDYGDEEAAQECEEWAAQAERHAANSERKVQEAADAATNAR